jgi:hypothetical protein
MAVTKRPETAATAHAREIEADQYIMPLTPHITRDIRFDG